MAAITWTSTPTIYSVTLPSGTTYYLKDADVRTWVGDGATSGAEKRISDLETSVGTLKAFAYVDQGEVTVTPSGTNSSSSVTFSGGTTDTFVKEYGSPASDTFVKSYPGASGKLVKTTVPNVTSAGSVGTAASWSATVSSENLTFAWTTNTPTTPATLGTAIDVATGAIANDGTGDTVMTGLGTATTASAVTGLGTATTATAVTGVGTATAAAQTFTGTATTYDVDPKSNS
jgi:hypothetical protein